MSCCPLPVRARGDGRADPRQDLHERRLIVNQSEAETVREIFRRYMELGCVRQLMEEPNRRGIRFKYFGAGRERKRSPVRSWADSSTKAARA
jgi:hypothetical protein